MENVKVFLVDFPHAIRGLATYYFGEDGIVYYSIFINAHMNSETQCKTYDHEISHINNGDFDKMYDINEVEWLRHAV